MVLVDTNIVFALLVQSTPWFDAARELYGRDDDWRTENHGMVELSNILSRYVRARLLKPADALAALSVAESRLGPQLVAVAHREALNMALNRKISAYDARFLRAAEMLGVPLVTEDAKLRKAAPDLTCSLADALTQR
jgi:predicted nucleic acid-binding protein